MKSIRRILNVTPEEDSKVVVLALGWAFTIGFTIAGKAARDAIFLSRYDKSYLPLMVVAIALAVALAVAACSRLGRVAKPPQILAATAALAAVSMLLFRLRLEGWTIPALYVWVDVVTVVLGLEFWLMASELVDSRQAKRLFGLIGGGGSIAAIAVGSQLKPFVSAFGSSGLLLLVAAFGIAAAVIGMIAANLAPVPQPAQRRRKEVGVNRKLNGYLVSIAIVVCAAAVASTLVDYQFKIIAAREIQSETDLVGFFGMFSAAAGLSSLIFQFVLTGRILSRFGILAGLALLPLGLGFTSAVILLSPVLAAAVLAKFSDQTLRFTVHNSGLECLWLPVPYARRHEVKPMITGTLKSSAEGMSGLLTFFLVKVIPLSMLSVLVLGACGVWLWSLFRLKALYSHALEEALRNRSIEYGDLDLDAQDPKILATVEKALRSNDETEQLFALELIQDMSLAPWASTLQELLGSAAPGVQSRILEIGTDDLRVVPDHLLIRSIGSEGAVAEAAIRASRKRSLEGIEQVLEKRSSDPHPGVRAASTRALFELALDRDRQEITLSAMLQGSEEDQLAALRELSDLPELMPDAMLVSFIQSASIRIREEALRIAADRGSLELIPFALDCLADQKTALVARETLLRLPSEPVSDQIAERLSSEATETSQRVSQVRMLRYLPPEKAYPLLCGQLVVKDPPVRVQVPDSLLVVCRRSQPPMEVLRDAETRGLDWIQAAYVANESLLHLPPETDATLLRDHFETVYFRSLSGLLKLLAIRRPTVPVETCLQIIASGDRSRVSFVLDLLDDFLPIAERRRVLPLFEPSLGTRSEVGRRLFPDLPTTLDRVLEASLRSTRDWEQAIALDYSFRVNLPNLHPMSILCVGPISAEVVSRVFRSHPEMNPMIQPSAISAVVERSSTMYSTLEKTIILKSASLFSEICAETLSRVAQMAEEVSFSDGSSVYREGDPGTAIYVVASGAIQAKAGSVKLAVLRRGDPFGEIAVLNRDVYRADLTAVEDSVLLRIDREDLFDLMQSSTEIMHGIISLLARRVVQVGDVLRENDSNRDGIIADEKEIQ